MNASHDHMFLGADHEENARRTLWVVILTVLMMVGEIAAARVGAEEIRARLQPVHEVGHLTVEVRAAM